jgi:hypothetical protein
MTSTLNSIATDVVGHYGNTAKSLVAAYRTTSDRALAAAGTRYAKLVERLPLVGAEGKARIVAAERRVAAVVKQGMARVAQRYDTGIERVSGQAVKGVEAFAERTKWAEDMLVVDAVRRIHLPAASLSLEVARRIDEAASTLSARVQHQVERPIAKPGVKKQRAEPVRRATGKRVRRAA